MEVNVVSTDNKIWNIEEVCTGIAIAKATTKELVLNFNHEAPDFNTLGLINLIDGYPTTVINLQNRVQKNLSNIKFIMPSYNGSFSMNKLVNVQVNKNILNAFGMFVGRSNVHRLFLSSYVYCNTKSTQTFHCNLADDAQKDNIGLEQLLQLYGTQEVDHVFKLIKDSPLTIDEVSYPIYYTQHHNIAAQYSKFLVDIVCESYYSGNTFYPTEKTWRPIMLLTPFIVQGPQWFLHRLHDLGFKTFDRWWDEGYAEDSADHQPLEIIKIIDNIKTKSISELNTMYEEMKPILQHNRQRFLELSEQDFAKCRLDA